MYSLMDIIIIFIIIWKRQIPLTIINIENKFHKITRISRIILLAFASTDSILTSVQIKFQSIFLSHFISIPIVCIKLLQQHFHCFHSCPHSPGKKCSMILFIILPFAVQATEPEIKRVVANQQQHIVHSSAHKELLSTASIPQPLPPFRDISHTCIIL